jgi:hypothetical protein
MTAPADLTPDGRGATFYEGITGDFDLKADDTELLAEVARMLDLLDALREAAKDGPIITDARGNLVVHPAIIEARQVREAVRKSLHALGVPDENGDTARTRSAREAAAARWGTA